MNLEEASAEREQLVAELDGVTADLVKINEVLRDTKRAHPHIRNRIEHQRKELVLKKQQIDKRIIEINRFMKEISPHVQQTNVVPIIRRLVGIIERLVDSKGVQLTELEQDVLDEAVEWVDNRERFNPAKYGGGGR